MGRYVLRVLKQYRLKVIVISGLLFISAAISCAYPLLGKHMMDQGFLNNKFEVILVCQLVVLSLAGLELILNIIRQKRIFDIKLDMQLTLHSEAIKKLFKVRLKYFKEHNPTEIITQIDTDITAISQLTNDIIFSLLINLCLCIGGAIGLIMIDLQLALLVFLYIPVKVAVTIYYAQKNEDINQSVISSKNVFVSLYEDFLCGIKEVRIFNLVETKELEHSEKARDFLSKQTKSLMIATLNLNIQSVLIQILNTTLYIFGAKMVIDSKISLGSVLAFITYSAYVISPISSIINIKYIISNFSPSVKRFSELMLLDEEYITGQQKIEPNEFNEISFNNVSFSYKDNDILLKNLNFSIKRNQKIAIIGSNGSGM